MAALSIKSRQQFQQDEIAAVQAALPGVFLFPEGSIVRALVDGHSSTAIWLQSNQQLLYNRERLATCVGQDVDTFVGDYRLIREGATASTGAVNFSRFTPTQSAFIAVNALVSTQTSAITFFVYADPLNPNFNQSLNGYVMQSGVPTISVPVQATVAGVSGNVSVGSITVINSPITGVDTVSNPLDFDNGETEETDTELKIRFVNYINGLSRATRGALEFAIESVQAGLEFNLVENVDYVSGLPSLGQFWAVIDDGSGTPPPNLLASVANALNAYRGLAIRFAVYAPIVINVAVTGDVILDPDFDPIGIIAQINSAVELYINEIKIGQTLYYNKIINEVLKINDLYLVPPIINVSNVLANGGTSDISSTPKESLKPFPLPNFTSI